MSKLKFWLSAGVLLAVGGCGGGDGDSSPTSPAAAGNPGTSVPEGVSITSANEVERHFAAGDYILWGFGFLNNGVPQVFVSKQSVDVSGSPTATKVAGAVGSVETPPSLFDLVSSLNYRKDGSDSSCSPKVGFEGTDRAVLTCSQPSLSGIGWTAQLKREDVAGKPVKDYIRNASGIALTVNWVHPETVFPAGSAAVTASLQANSDMVVSSRFTLQFFEDPVGGGWCAPVPGQTYSLGVRLNEGNTTSLFEVPSTSSCDFTGLAQIAAGSWTSTSATAGNTYRLTHPAAVVSAPKWAALFAGAKTPTSRLGTVIQPCSGRSWCLAHDVKRGDKFDSVQPHFNEAALPALKSVHGL